MKSRSVFNSFRFEVILYSVLSLLYTIVTEAIVYCLGYYIKVIVDSAIFASENNISLSSALHNIWNMPIENNTSFLDGGSSTGLTHSLTSVLSINRDNLIITVIIAVVIGMILFVLYFLLLTRNFSKYLFEISDGIKQIAAGNLDTRIRVKNEDEFAVIAESVNKMAGELGEMIEQERKNEEMKHELITSVAHDLRTPLTSIIGYLDLARQEKENSDKKEKYMQIAYEKSKRMESLIEDLFSYTKFTSGEVKANRQKLNMVKLVEQMLEEFYPSFQEAGLVCELICEEDKIYINADGSLLARAIGNLLGNAVKYGQADSKITVVMRREADHICLSVVNYGAEIPGKDLPYIFDKFYRVEGSRSADTGGTGLGLAIAKSIVLLHDGGIAADSQNGKTEFVIKLPL